MLALRRWLKDDRGATAIEYALVASLIGCAIIGTVRIVGSDIGSVLTSISDQFSDAPTAGPPPATPNALHG